MRRALGATKSPIAVQFMGEALLLSLIGAVAGVAMGYGATAAWSAYRDWTVLVPQIALVGGLGAGTSSGRWPASTRL